MSSFSEVRIAHGLLTVRAGLVCLALTLMLSLLSPARGTASTSSEVDCVDTFTNVALVAGGPESYRVHGELCRPAGSSSDMVQILLPGATYNHYYWDLPYQPENYSYVRHMNDAGYTTFNIDRIGTGTSSHPASALLSIPSNAFVVHQLVQKLRAGQVTGTHYSTVVLVGHSLGTLIGMTEAARYRDVDGFIATGVVHKLNPGFAPKVNILLYPALLDPKFRDRDLGYLTSRPGARGGPLFYEAGHFDPGALAADETYARDTVTAVELGLFPGPLVDGSTQGIEAPTLVVMGSEDKIFCGGLVGEDCSSAEALYAQEKPFYPNAELSTYVQQGSGHCNNMHLNAKDWYNAATDWLTSTFPDL